jgi:hypothetical protein
MEEIGFGLPEPEKVGYGLTGLAWNSRSRVWPESTILAPQNQNEITGKIQTKNVQKSEIFQRTTKMEKHCL